MLPTSLAEPTRWSINNHLVGSARDVGNMFVDSFSSSENKSDKEHDKKLIISYLTHLGSRFVNLFQATNSIQSLQTLVYAPNSSAFKFCAHVRHLCYQIAETDSIAESTVIHSVANALYPSLKAHYFQAAQLQPTFFKSLNNVFMWLLHAERVLNQRELINETIVSKPATTNAIQPSVWKTVQTWMELFSLILKITSLLLHLPIVLHLLLRPVGHLSEEHQKVMVHRLANVAAIPTITFHSAMLIN